jgi:thioredoxin reductase
VEAAASVAEAGGRSVVLSYRGEAFAKANQANRDRVARAEQSGKLKVLLKSNVREIAGEAVVIERDGRLLKLSNDAVIVNAGGVLPTDFLRHIGINVEAKFGTA